MTRLDWASFLDHANNFRAQFEFGCLGCSGLPKKRWQICWPCSPPLYCCTAWSSAGVTFSFNSASVNLIFNQILRIFSLVFYHFRLAFLQNQALNFDGKDLRIQWLYYPPIFSAKSGDKRSRNFPPISICFCSCLSRHFWICISKKIYCFLLNFRSFQKPTISFRKTK